MTRICARAAQNWPKEWRRTGASALARYVATISRHCQTRLVYVRFVPEQVLNTQSNSIYNRRCLKDMKQELRLSVSACVCLTLCCTPVSAITTYAVLGPKPICYSTPSRSYIRAYHIRSCYNRQTKLQLFGRLFQRPTDEQTDKRTTERGVHVSSTHTIVKTLLGLAQNPRSHRFCGILGNKNLASTVIGFVHSSVSMSVCHYIRSYCIDICSTHRSRIWPRKQVVKGM